MEARQVAHFIPYLGAAMGGPVAGMAAYANLLTNAGYAVSAYSVLQAGDGESVGLDSRVQQVQEAVRGWGGFRRSPALWQRAQASKVSVIHSHGLWTDVHRLAGALARRRGVPHMLAPCGMLAPGALHRHWWKKLPIRLWFQDRALREAQCLHAKSCREYEHFRRFGLKNPVAVIPNPVGGRRGEGVRESGEGRGEREEGQRTVLFLGRLHPVKGLDRLVRAWAAIQSRKQKAESRKERGEGRGEKWVLVLAGPDEGGYRREVESLVGDLGCAHSVVFTGQLDENQKWEALAGADLFVMPSDFENFGNAIVEAMSCAVPVITTTGTPWEELKAAGAGWWVAARVEELTSALREAMALTDSERKAMGERGAKLAERFRPERVAADLIQVYEWLLGRGARPECVRTD